MRLLTTSDSVAPVNRPCWTRASSLILCALMAGAAVLRFSFLVRKRFWFDECFSVEVARLGWSDFAMLLWRREANMSLYYLLLRGWLHFGSSPFFIRSLSVIFSLATLPAIFWLAGKLYDRRVALLAVALMSVNAYHIRYAEEARSYSLFVLLATLSSGFFVATAHKPSRRNRLLYVLFSVLAVYAHLYALLLLAAQWLSVQKWGRNQIDLRARAQLQAWIWIGIATLPLIIFVAKTGAGPIRWIHRPEPHDLLEFAEHLAGNDGLLLLLLFVTACAYAVLPRKPTGELSEAELDWLAWRLRFLSLWLIFPVILVLLLSLARPLFLGRYFIFCLPAFAILAAAGIAKVHNRWILALSLVAILALSLQGTFSYYHHDFDLERDDSQAATYYVLDHAQAGDAIMFHIAEARVPYEFFKSIRNATSEASAERPTIVYPRHGERLDYRDFSGKPASDLVDSTSKRYSRLWLVLMSNGLPGNPDATTLMLDQTLGNSYALVDRQRFTQVEVRLYTSLHTSP